MHQKMLKLVWALLILAGGLTAALTPTNVEALTCRDLLNQCTAQCDPNDSLCAQECQCVFLNCRGYQCN